MATKYYGVPFGNTGDKTTIPDPLQPSGDVSYELGWTPLYELNPVTDPSAKRIERAKHNQIFNDLTTNIKQLQDFGVPEYFNLTAKPAGYSKNSRVLFTDGEVYISLVNSNTDTPPSVNWKMDTIPTSGISQTVRSSSVDSNGQPDYISIGTGLSVNISATTTPVIMSASISNSANNRIGIVSADTSISGLTDSTTNYLYGDIGVDGVVVLGSTILAPTYQFGGTYSVTSGQSTFNISEMTMKVGNGASADQTFRVFIGEAVTAGGVVTSVRNYALNGIYYSSLQTITASGQLLLNANMGFTPYNLELFLVNQSASLGYNVGDYVLTNSQHNRTDGTPIGTSIILTSTILQLRYSVSTNCFSIANATTGLSANITNANWKLRILAKRGW